MRAVILPAHASSSESTTSMRCSYKKGHSSKTTCLLVICFEVSLSIYSHSPRRIKMEERKKKKAGDGGRYGGEAGRQGTNHQHLTKRWSKYTNKVKKQRQAAPTPQSSGTCKPTSTPDMSPGPYNQHVLSCLALCMTQGNQNGAKHSRECSRATPQCPASTPWARDGSVVPLAETSGGLSHSCQEQK